MATQPIENIEAVLGRFQAWAGTRNAAEVGTGIREVPYEEALASSRYRWKGAGANSAKKAAGRPEKTSIAPAKTEPDKKRRAAKPARGREERKVTREAKTETAKVASPSRPTVGNHGIAAKSAAPRRNITAAEPEFREALAAAIGPAEVVVARPVELSRQVAISIRLAASERALIKKRAAEAGITTSAYIRQCALEVEQLREQVRSAVAAMERGVALPASISELASTPAPAAGFFARMRRRFFPRSTPALAWRA